MIDGVVDVRIVLASEEVGNADPRALLVAENAAEAYERFGSPVGGFALVQALVYLAVAPKSNVVNMARHQVLSFVRTDRARPIAAAPAQCATAAHEGARLQEGLPLRA
ncbi:hypothetical protein AYM40_07525 [Paraburkholderia phytofirmans OLGA172]|uniref:MgsA AAA+ ATPase C-terminal domain-containing protein n=1 Tax=Paraburkholderia phytofirmans OLGA172 TaxID=1417228 RepID=A0A160FJU7_9BURK|nr:hypothetical protein AYM40_07525 [Paraburkholderia phytofirmans OLGA172]